MFSTLKLTFVFLQIYEPAEIAARHLTQVDEIIRNIDLPERFQILQRAYLPSITYDQDHPLLLEESVGEEVKYDPFEAAAAYIAPRISSEITRRFFQEDSDPQDPLRLQFIDSVTKVLQEMHGHNSCEVPFILLHRRDILYAPSLGNDAREAWLDRSALWRILHLSFEFRGLQERRRGLARRFEKLNISDEYWTNFLFDRCASSLEGTTDLAEWLSLMHGNRAKAMREEQAFLEEKTRLKNATRKTKYTRAKADNDVRNFIEEAAISPIKLIKLFYGFEESTFKVTDPVHRPDFAAAVAGEHNRNGFSDGFTMLAAARHVLATEIFHDPLLRASFRGLFEKSATINVQPTERGRSVIDDRHPYASFKYVSGRPVSTFEGTPQYLLFASAEQDGLVDITIDGGSTLASHFIEALGHKFFSENTSEVSEEWNNWRRAILTDAVNSLQVHSAEWVKQKMTREAQDLVLGRISSELEGRIECIPYTADPERERGQTPSVIALSFGAGEYRKDDVHAVFLDNKGRMRESTRFETLAPVRETRPQHEQDRSNTSRDAFRAMMNDKKPTVIVVGGWTIRTRELLADVRALASEVNLPVIMVEDSTARLFRNSPDAVREFQELHEIGRYCVGLARYVQCPAAEYAALSTSQLEGVSFDPFQKYLPAERLRFQLEQSLVNVINYTGVDLNRAVRNPYYQKQLPFVSGLGPRKANMLADKLTSFVRTSLNGPDLMKTRLIISSFRVAPC